MSEVTAQEIHDLKQMLSHLIQQTQTQSQPSYVTVEDVTVSEENPVDSQNEISRLKETIKMQHKLLTKLAQKQKNK